MANFVFNSFLNGVAHGKDYFSEAPYAIVLNRDITAEEKNKGATSAFSENFATDTNGNTLAKPITGIEVDVPDSEGNTIVKAPFVNYAENGTISVSDTYGVLIATTTANEGENIAYYGFGEKVSVTDSDFRVIFSGGNTANPPTKGTMLKFKNA